LIVVLSRAAVDAGADINEIFLINENFTENINEFSNLEDLSIWVTNMLQRFISFTFEFDKVKHADAVYKVIEYIKANFQRRMSLEEIAASTYLSKTYLSSLFKKETGYSISEYINIVRIERSKSLLLEENISIIDIANLCGFEDQSYFTKVFKHIVGITPKKYRENRGKNVKRILY
jgi:AraC-like DNA-binding protein